MRTLTFQDLYTPQNRRANVYIFYLYAK